MRQCIRCKTKNTEQDISLHKFPKDEAILKQWVQNMGCDSSYRPLQSHFLCSLHFTDDCYNGKCLKKDSVPTIFKDNGKFRIKLRNRSKKEVSVDSFAPYNDALLNVNKDSILSQNTARIEEEDIVHNGVDENDREPTINIENVNYIYVNVEKYTIKSEQVEDNNDLTVTVEAENPNEYGISDVKHDIKSEILDVQIEQVEINSKEIQTSYDTVKIKGEVNDSYEDEDKTDVQNDIKNEFVDVKVEVLLSKEIQVDFENVNIKTEAVEANERCTFGIKEENAENETENCKSFDEIELEDKDNYIEIPINLCYKMPNINANNEIENSNSGNIRQNVDTENGKNETSRKPFACEICSKSFKYRFDLTRHMNEHTSATILNCSYCSYETYRRSSLNRHVNAKHTKNTIFYCSYCEYKTFLKISLSAHINAKHTKSTTFDCSLCSYKTYQKGLLRRHIHASHIKTLFSCSICSYKTYQKDHLAQHIKGVHDKSTIFSCSYCSFKTCRKNSLNVHINAKHTKSESFNCPHCDHVSYYKYSLENHIAAKHLNI